MDERNQCFDLRSGELRRDLTKLLVVSIRKQGEFLSHYRLLVDFFVCLMHNIYSAAALFLLRKKARQYSVLLMFLTRRERFTREIRVVYAHRLYKLFSTLNYMQLESISVILFHIYSCHTILYTLIFFVCIHYLFCNFFERFTEVLIKTLIF